jgi:hypothetical protein
MGLGAGLPVGGQGQGQGGGQGGQGHALRVANPDTDEESDLGEVVGRYYGTFYVFSFLSISTSKTWDTKKKLNIFVCIRLKPFLSRSTTNGSNDDNDKREF